MGPRPRSAADPARVHRGRLVTGDDVRSRTASCAHCAVHAGTPTPRARRVRAPGRWPPCGERNHGSLVATKVHEDAGRAAGSTSSVRSVSVWTTETARAPMRWLVDPRGVVGRPSPVAPRESLLASMSAVRSAITSRRCDSVRCGHQRQAAPSCVRSRRSALVRSGAAPPRCDRRQRRQPPEQAVCAGF